MNQKKKQHSLIKSHSMTDLEAVFYYITLYVILLTVWTHTGKHVILKTNSTYQGHMVTAEKWRKIKDTLYLCCVCRSTDHMLFNVDWIISSASVVEGFLSAVIIKAGGICSAPAFQASAERRGREKKESSKYSVWLWHCCRSDIPACR